MSRCQHDLFDVGAGVDVGNLDRPFREGQRPVLGTVPVVGAVRVEHHIDPECHVRQSESAVGIRDLHRQRIQPREIPGRRIDHRPAAFRFAAVPVTVNEAEPFRPVVKLKPVVDASVIVPCMTDIVREFEPLPAAEPLKLMGLPLLVEKTSDRFWSSVPEGRNNRRRASAVTV